MAEGCFGMIPSEEVVLAVVFTERARGTLTRRVGALLWALALLASAAAVLHMEAW